MLALEKVSKVYRIGAFGLQRLTAVRNVSFEIGEREIVSLIGESGSGKSTIGKLILRLTPITAGMIRFDGMDISTLKGGALKEYYRKVQGVFQDPFASYNPIFKADRIFAMVRDEFFPDVGVREWKEKVEEALSCVGLNPPDVLGRFPHQLSGGQLQRFLIARALLLDICLLVADEIISMLDASTRIDVLNLLTDLKAHGLSILFITHDLSLAYYVSDWAMILYGGRILEMGPTDRVYLHPLHPYTEMLMESVPRLDRRWEEAIQIEKAARSGRSVVGCVYADRCPEAMEICTHQEPELVEAETGHFVACLK